MFGASAAGLARTVPRDQGDVRQPSDGARWRAWRPRSRRPAPRWPKHPAGTVPLVEPEKDWEGLQESSTRCFPEPQPALICSAPPDIAVPGNATGRCIYYVDWAIGVDSRTRQPRLTTAVLLVRSRAFWPTDRAGRGLRSTADGATSSIRRPDRQRRDVAIWKGKIVRIAANISTASARQTAEVKGLSVVPGWWTFTATTTATAARSSRRFRATGGYETVVDAGVRLT